MNLIYQFLQTPFQSLQSAVPPINKILFGFYLTSSTHTSTHTLSTNASISFTIVNKQIHQPILYCTSLSNICLYSETFTHLVHHYKHLTMSIEWFHYIVSNFLSTLYTFNTPNMQPPSQCYHMLSPHQKMQHISTHFPHLLPILSHTY